MYYGVDRGVSVLYCLESEYMGLWLGIRVTQKFWVGFFVFSKFRVLKTATRNSLKKIKTRKFGYPTFRVRVRVYPTNPNCREEDEAGCGRERAVVGDEVRDEAAREEGEAWEVRGGARRGHRRC